MIREYRTAAPINAVSSRIPNKIHFSNDCHSIHSSCGRSFSNLDSSQKKLNISLDNLKNLFIIPVQTDYGNWLTG